jgi:hypothetical protein
MPAGAAPSTVADMGCLLALLGGAFPRLALFMFWILRPARVDAAFDTWLVPLLGIVFLPFATLMYTILHTPGVGLTGWEWFWVVVAGLLDVGHLAAASTRRGEIPGVSRRGAGV